MLFFYHKEISILLLGRFFISEDSYLIDLFLSNSGSDSFEMKDVESLEVTASHDVVTGQPRYVGAELTGGVPMMSAQVNKCHDVFR